MENFTPLEKLSKRKKKEIAAKKRGSWGSLNPVTRKPASPKAYDRKKSRKIGDDADFPGFFYMLFLWYTT